MYYICRVLGRLLASPTYLVLAESNSLGRKMSTVYIVNQPCLVRTTEGVYDVPSVFSISRDHHMTAVRLWLEELMSLLVT